MKLRKGDPVRVITGKDKGKEGVIEHVYPKANKVIVTITERVRHARYNKFILQSKKLYTHDETNDAGVGDKVRVMECRPLSKSKRWRLVEVTERAR